MVYGEIVEVICVGLVKILLEKRVYWGGVYVGIVVHIVDDVGVTVATDIIVIIVRIIDILRNIRRTHPTITVNRTVPGSIIIRVITAIIRRILVTIHSIYRTHAVIISRNNFHATLVRDR